LRKAGNKLLSLKAINMPRLKQIQTIDNLIQSIKIIAESQCSLSEQDNYVLNEALKRLQSLNRKKGKTNKQILKEFAKVVELLNSFFV
jgi:acetyl-CoA carboxylase alpha subunit